MTLLLLQHIYTITNILYYCY